MAATGPAAAQDNAGSRAANDGAMTPTVGTGEGARAQQATAPAVPEIDQAAFTRWLEDLKAEARAQGISEKTLQTVLGDVQPIRRVLELDRFQPEFTQTFWTYLNRAVDPRRLERGRQMLRAHADLLAAVGRQYGVQPRFLVAFWGLETNFGATFGGFPVIDALATLAFDERRAAFFRSELLDALAIVDAGHIDPERMVGSWAGAMGHLQFMPSTFRQHAVDRDGDGRADIWDSLPDVFASAANYLAAEGWKGDETWGREVSLPVGFDLDLAGLAVRKPLAEWADLGVRKAGGGPLPVVAGMEGSILLPAGIEGPAFIVYDNFRTTLAWNRSILYALAIGHLADRLIGKPPLAAEPPPGTRPLSRREVQEIQRLLNTLGFEAGEVDGLPGSQTRAALKAFQKSIGLPPDGHPDAPLLARLRTAASARSGASINGAEKGPIPARDG